MSQFLQFVGQEWLLISLLFGLAAALMWHEGKKGGAALSPAQMTSLINAEDALVLDIREAKDFKAGHIVGAKNVPMAKIASELPNLEKHKAKPVVVICRFGQTAGACGKQLREAGFEKVYKLGGGMVEWQAQQMPVVKA